MHICCCKAFNCDKRNFTSTTAPTEAAIKKKQVKLNKIKQTLNKNPINKPMSRKTRETLLSALEEEKKSTEKLQNQLDQITTKHKIKFNDDESHAEDIDEYYKFKAK